MRYVSTKLTHEGFIFERCLRVIQFLIFITLLANIIKIYSIKLKRFPPISKFTKTFRSWHKWFQWHALAGVSDPTLWRSHSREDNHSESTFHCVFNKPVQFKILIVIIRKYKRYITTYYSRLIYRLLPIVSLVYSGVSHITVGETITESSLLFIETQYLSCLRSFSVKPLDLFTNRCSKVALIRDENYKYLCFETEFIPYAYYLSVH